jgi:hypothetical protein
MLIKDLLYLHHNFFFNSIALKIFQKRYYGKFEQLTFKRGENLFKEMDPIDCIYLIRNGEIELSFCKSALEIHKLFQVICSSSNSKEAEKNCYEPRNGKFILTD